MRRLFRVTPVSATLALILLTGTALRLWHIDFGLPSLNDPDEPLFVMTALDMVRGHTLDPGWFGHPAATLFYALSVIFVAIGMIGAMLGQWSGASGYVAALYADPSIAILPMRLFIMACGVTTLWLTFRLGRRAFGPGVGLIAVALLACSDLHVELSQVIRTDMLAAVFMLWSSCHAVAIARGGRSRDHVLAGVAAGLACATKWPAATVLANAAAATLAYGWTMRGSWRRLPVAPLVAGATLLAVSPYILVDYPTVVHDLGGEMRSAHPGATGHGFVANLLWYVTGPLAHGFGPIGAVLMVIGLLVMTTGHRTTAAAILPGGAAFLVLIAAQTLTWERWIVPILPIAALLAAIGLEYLATLAGRRRSLILALGLALMLVPMASTTLARGRMRATDTRQIATQWVRDHVAPDRSILIEHAAFDLLDHPGKLLFPLGKAGCVDVRQSIRAQPSYRRVGRLRRGSAIVDLGHVAPDRLGSCAADILILSHYTRYRNEAAAFPDQLAIYRAIMHGGRVLARIDPQPGTRSGPVILIVERPLGGKWLK